MSKENKKSTVIKKFEQFINENNVRYSEQKQILGDFLKKHFPKVEFTWDEDSKGWWTADENFVNTYSSERISYNYKAEAKIKGLFRLEHDGRKLIVNSDFDWVQITLD